VLADTRYSSDRVRYKDATQMQPHEVAEMAAAAGHAHHHDHQPA
jgi:hypothetical protein